MVAFTRRALMPVLAAPAILPAVLYKQRDILSKDWSAEKVAGALLAAKEWKPLPRYADRAAWEGLPAEVRGHIVEEAAALQKEPWASLPASVYLDFARNGNRSRYERIRFARGGKVNLLGVAECIEGRGRFLDSVVEGVWME